MKDRRKVSKYLQMSARDFIPIHEAFKTQCCDCGLVHTWDFIKHKGIFGFVVARDNRATGQCRRKR